ncbi:lipase 3-like [Ischnura elegans]|uniref:lipase 3-like n=1 Tax=Ischnura elegans TaxID=197161 RepID=UPI001ED8A978|nr:lipase 3-like [Ischnura elegans]
MAAWKIALVTLAVATVAMGAMLPPRDVIEAMRRQSRVADNPDNPDDNPDIYLGTPDLIKRRGYPVEVHEVETDDHYLLSLHRIPHGINDDANSTEKRPVAYLQHGLIASSSDWVIMGPEQGLAYILADAGYDVWMGNCRGNRYSRKHATLDPDNAEFWDFSWHEMALHDIPAELDYVLEHTGQSKLHYIGHSMGTTMFFVMNSLKPQYNTKFHSMFALAPIAYMDKVKSPIRLMAPFIDQVEWLSKMIGMNEFMPNNAFMDFIGEAACKNEAPTQAVCSNVMFLLCGYDTQELNVTALPVMLSHTPAGTATKVVIHYGQEIKSGKFRQYDYGLVGNLEHYKSIHPPEYDLGLVSAPVYLFYSENDWFAHPDDVEKLKQGLPNVQGKFLVSLESFNHLDYLWAIDVKTLVYDKVMSLMKRAE